MYNVKEIYYTLQGEGAFSGRPSVFCRFSGCNLWSGKEKDRKLAKCNFCDTDFVGVNGINGGKFISELELGKKIISLWKSKNINNKPYVVFTGGEPLLQLDKKLINFLKNYNFEIGIETNGTLKLPCEIDWVCVSPKHKNNFILKKGDELKLVFPQKKINPKNLENLKFKYFFLQPMDGPNLKENIKKTYEYCNKNKKWNVSLQLHKMIGIR